MVSQVVYGKWPHPRAPLMSIWS